MVIIIFICCFKLYLLSFNVLLVYNNKYGGKSYWISSWKFQIKIYKHFKNTETIYTVYIYIFLVCVSEWKRKRTEGTFFLLFYSSFSFFPMASLYYCLFEIVFVCVHLCMLKDYLNKGFFGSITHFTIYFYKIWGYFLVIYFFTYTGCLWHIFFILFSLKSWWKYLCYVQTIWLIYLK